MTTPPAYRSMPCAQCGKAMWRSKTSLPPGQARCRPCRRESSARRPRRKPFTIGDQRPCQRCGQVFVMQIKNQRLCWDPCRKRKSGGNSPASVTERGYGTAHQRARASARAAWQDGDPCARCGGPMYHGTSVDLDHTDDRTGYLGLSHAGCNRSSTGRLQAVKVRLSCDHCNLPFESRWGDQRYCSPTCRRTSRTA